MKLFLRLYADCPSTATASIIDAKIRSALSAWSPNAFSRPEQYWKLPEQFGFTYNLSPAKGTSFEAIMRESTAGWSQSETNDGERSAVWNRAADSVFLTFEVTWANLELHA